MLRAKNKELKSNSIVLYKSCKDLILVATVLTRGNKSVKNIGASEKVV